MGHIHSEYLKCELQVTKSLKQTNIDNLYLCFKEEETYPILTS